VDLNSKCHDKNLSLTGDARYLHSKMVRATLVLKIKFAEKQVITLTGHVYDSRYLVLGRCLRPNLTGLTIRKHFYT